MKPDKRTLIIGNWKMHLNTMQSSILIHRLQERIKIYRDVEVVLAPSMLVLQPLSLQIDRRKFRLAAQNAFYKDEGAYTGEISMTMLRDLVHYVVIGHSERRHIFAESNRDVSNKMDAAVRNGITPILCVGETKAERLAGHTRRVIHDQVMSALKGLTASEIEDLVIAYEPVWAIGTGDFAKPDQAKQAMDYIRLNIAELYSQRTANKVRILYGGSVDEQTARSYLELEGCNGVFVGGASINYHKFSAIVDTAYRLRQEDGES